ncbi:zinc-binding protein A33-like [Arapaima gigas]
MKSPCQDVLVGKQESLKKQKDSLMYRMEKLTAKQVEVTKKSTALKENVTKTYERMKAVLDEDLRITLTHLDMESLATIRTIEDHINRCYCLVQDIERELIQLGGEQEQEQALDWTSDQLLKVSNPDFVKLDEPKAEQLLGMTNNLLVFIRSQMPIARRLLQSYTSEVVLDVDTAHPKLVISPDGRSARYTDTWQELPEKPSRFDNTLNVLGLHGFSKGRHYWEVEVAGKTYWELGLTYPSIPRKGQKEDCWLGRSADSWGLEFFNGVYTAWHRGMAHEVPVSSCFERIGVFCSFHGGLILFLGVDSTMPLFSFCAGMFTDYLHPAMCPGHDSEGTNCRPLRICSTPKPVSSY